MSARIFISATTKEYAELRTAIVEALHRHSYELYYQNYFCAGGLHTPSMLSDWIEDNDVIVHFVGLAGGEAPKPAELEALIGALPEFAKRLPRIAAMAPEELASITYTDWEAWLALYHRKYLLVLEPVFGAAAVLPRTSTDGDAQARGLHLERLARESDAYKPRRVEALVDAVDAITALAHRFEWKQRKQEPATDPGVTPRDIERLASDEVRIEREPDLRAIVLAAQATPAEEPRRCVALWGEPGIGKSSIVGALGDDRDIRAAYPGGVLETSLGPLARAGIVNSCLRLWAAKVDMPNEEASSATNDQALKEAIRRRIDDRPALIVIDDVWSKDVAMALRIDGPHCFHVFSTRTPALASRLVPEDCDLQVLPLDSARSLEFVRSFSRKAFADPQVAKRIGQAVHAHAGLPLVLRIIGTELRLKSKDPDRILDYLDRLEAARSLPEELDRRYSASYNHLGIDLRQGLARLAVLKPAPFEFTFELANAVSGHVFDRIMTESGLLHDVERPLAPLFIEPGRRQTTYSMHQSIAEWLRPKASPDDVREVSGVAADWIEKQIRRRDAAKRTESDYEAWYCFEDPAWHQAMYDLRHFLVHAQEYDRLVFVLTNAWLRGFWWWDCYSDDTSMFCRNIVADWPRIAGAGNIELANALADIVCITENYVKESDPRRDAQPERWRKARAALERIYVRHRLADPLLEDNELNDFLSLLHIFIAESWRYCERSALDTLSNYHEAVDRLGKAFDDDQVKWNLSWAQWHLADALLEFEDDAASFELCEKILEQEFGKPRWDQEILSRAYLLAARHDLVAERTQRAAERLHDAIYYAYRFQLYHQAGPGSEPSRSDHYTLKNYPEIAFEAAEILLEAEDPGQGLAAALAIDAHLNARTPRAAAIRAFFDGVPAGGDNNPAKRASDLSDALFPRPLLDDHDQWQDERAVRAYEGEVSARLQDLAPLLG